MNKLTIHYAPGPPVSDFDLETVYKDLITRARRGDVTVTHSTANIFERVRVGIVRGEILHGNVRFCYQGEELEPDENGRLERWPDGFLDVTERLLEELI